MFCGKITLMYGSFLTQYVTKPMAMLYETMRDATVHALCDGVFNTVRLFVMLYWENSHIFRDIQYFSRLYFKLNNLITEKFDVSELKLSWRSP